MNDIIVNLSYNNSIECEFNLSTHKPSIYTRKRLDELLENLQGALFNSESTKIEARYIRHLSDPIISADTTLNISCNIKTTYDRDELHHFEEPFSKICHYLMISKRHETKVLKRIFDSYSDDRLMKIKFNIFERLEERETKIGIKIYHRLEDHNTLNII